MRAFLRGAAVLALTVAACSGSDEPKDPNDPTDPGPDPTDEDDPPTPEETARDNDELAQILGAHVRGEFAIMLAAAEISESRLPEGFALTGDGTGTGTVGSMTYNFTYWCNDGTTAHTVVPCDGLAHHSHVQMTMQGSQSVGSMAMDQLARQVDWEIRDLTLDKARFRGPDQAALHTTVTTNGEATSYALKLTAVYEKVRFMPAAAFPTFGTIDFNVNADRTRGEDHRVFNATAQLVYGSSGVPTTLTIDGANQYTIDLTTGDVAKL